MPYAGSVNAGTVFQMNPDVAGSYTTVVSFHGSSSLAPDQPLAGLIADADGNLFGTTALGGLYQKGTVFEIKKTNGVYDTTPTILVSFNPNLTTDTQGANPQAGLIADKQGNLFGTTQAGGAYGLGTVFELQKDATSTTGYTLHTLVSFRGTDGANPQAGLIADKQGNLFGTTILGGPPGVSPCGIAYLTVGCGTVFEVKKTNGVYDTTPTVLVTFDPGNGTDGATPQAGLLADAAGNLFGTTSQGGAYSLGTVFEVTGSGFVVSPIFAGTPRRLGCVLKSDAALIRQYRSLRAAASALGYRGPFALERAIVSYCAG